MTNDRRVTDPDADWIDPRTLPKDLDPIQRAIIAARNVRAWADWLLEIGPAPKTGKDLVDVGEGKVAE